MFKIEQNYNYINTFEYLKWVNLQKNDMQFWKNPRHAKLLLANKY